MDRLSVPYILAVAILVIMQLTLPRRWAFLPLLVAACNLAKIEVFSLGGVAMSVYRVLILVGLLRAMRGGLQLAPQNRMDWLVLGWAAWAIFSAFCRDGQSDYNPVTVALSLALDYMGVFFYARAFIRTGDDMVAFGKVLAVCLMVLAACLAVEKITTHNVYAFLGAEYETAWIRGGKVRAAGPFGNAILAGTLGGVSFPLMIMLRPYAGKLAAWGAIACLVIVYASASSGPVLSFAAGCGALYLWHKRFALRQLITFAIFMVLGLALVMEAPVWYLIARVDITGSSTSFHRAELIDQAVRHLSDWWAVGTDYTRDWMPYGIEWSANHVDITNHYLKMGVLGGVLLMGFFMMILWTALRGLNRKVEALRELDDPAEFTVWCIGAALFAHCVTFLGVSYFDQSFVFLCLLLGAIPNLTASEGWLTEEAPEEEESDPLRGGHRTSPSGAFVH